RTNQLRKAMPVRRAIAVKLQLMCSLPISLIAKVLATRPTMISKEPLMSQGREVSGVERGTSSQPKGKAIKTIGTLIRKTDPHQKCSSKKPPRTGPKAAPPDAIDDQTPKATARSRSS